MALVDYASDDDVSEEEEDPHQNPSPPQPSNHQSPPPSPPAYRGSDSSSNHQKPATSAEPSPPPLEKLPDAWSLLNSPCVPALTGSDHASRVAAAMAESASRKRDAKGVGTSLPRGKLPRSTLPQAKVVPDTGGSLLLPPQLTGRSNVVTEDISKLFVKKHADLQFRGSQS